MKYTPQGVWDLYIDLPIAGGKKLGYKYCILDDNQPNGGIPFWEPALDHEIEIPTDNTLLIECIDMWGVRL
jgi:hypothetical protein